MTLLAESQVGRTDGWLHTTGSGLRPATEEARFGGPLLLIFRCTRADHVELCDPRPVYRDDPERAAV